MNAKADVVCVPIADLRRLAGSLLTAVGGAARHVDLVVGGLVDADVEDQSSHGILLLPMYVERIVAGSVAPAGEGRVVSDTPTSIVIDAENALGQVTSEKAVGLCLARAREHGMAAAAVRNGFHFGTANRWARRIAEAGSTGSLAHATRPLTPAPA